MKGTTFQIPKEKAALNPSSIMGDQEGIYFTFMSDMGAIASLLPAPLEPAMPLVSGYIVEIRKPAFSEAYMEAMLGVYVKMGDTVGMYPVTFLLSGAGAEMATYLGREQLGLPKKVCDAKGGIYLTKEGDRIRGIVERKGVRLMDVSMELGAYNNPMTGDVYSHPEPGKKTGGTSFYFKPCLEPDGNGRVRYASVDLLTNDAEYTYYAWTPGKVSIRLKSSEYDAWGQLPVLENLGGGYTNNDLEMKEVYLAEKLSADDAMPYLLSMRFDKEALL